MSYVRHPGTRRERGKDLVFDEIAHFDVVRSNSGGVEEWSAEVLETRWQLFERMTDWHGDYVREELTNRWCGYQDNEVAHHIYRLGKDYKHNLLPVVSYESHQTTQYFPAGDGCVPTPHPLELEQLIPYPPDEILEDNARRALRRFFKQMPQEVEGLNFLYEIKKIHELVPRVLSSLAATIAAGYLNWSFGWAPFLSDLRKLFNITNTVQQRLRYLRETWGKKIRLSYKKEDIWQPPAVPFYVDTGNLPFRTRAERVEYRADIQCNAWLTHHLDQLDDKLTEIRALAIALGFGNPLQAIWQAIPFSFIVDWVLGVSTVFEESGFTNISNGDFWVFRPTYSIVVNGTLRLGQYTVWQWPIGWVPSSIVSRGTIRVRHYKRYLGVPSLPDLFDLDALTSRQASLILAIAVSGNGHRP